MLWDLLCESIKQTPVGKVMLTVDQNSTEEFYTKYLHDFVRIVHMCTQSDGECESREYEVS